MFWTRAASWLSSFVATKVCSFRPGSWAQGLCSTRTKSCSQCRLQAPISSDTAVVLCKFCSTKALGLVSWSYRGFAGRLETSLVGWLGQIQWFQSSSTSRVGLHFDFICFPALMRLIMHGFLWEFIQLWWATYVISPQESIAWQDLSSLRHCSDLPKIQLDVRFSGFRGSRMLVSCKREVLVLCRRLQCFGWRS